MRRQERAASDAVAEEEALEEARAAALDAKWVRERRLQCEHIQSWLGIVGRAMLGAFATGAVSLGLAWLAGWLRLPPSR